MEVLGTNRLQLPLRTALMLVGDVNSPDRVLKPKTKKALNAQIKALKLAKEKNSKTTSKLSKLPIYTVVKQ